MIQHRFSFSGISFFYEEPSVYLDNTSNGIADVAVKLLCKLTLPYTCKLRQRLTKITESGEL